MDRVFALRTATMAAPGAEAVAARQQGDRNIEAAKWAAAAERVREGERNKRAPCVPNDEAAAPSGRERADYCSNELRAKATHDRIWGEALNGCVRIKAGAASWYVTPPLNSYYRRKVHLLAEAYHLQHETIPDVRTVTVDNFTGKTCEDCNTRGGWCMIHASATKEAKTVLITGGGNIINSRPSTTKDASKKEPAIPLALAQLALARARAASKCPDRGGGGSVRDYVG